MVISPEAHFILQSIVIIVLPYTLWKIKAVKNLVPLVVIQIFIGILLGPSFLGRIDTNVYKFLFPTDSIISLNSLYWLALILFGFLTGLHVNPEEIVKKGKKYLLTSVGSLIIPSLFGALVASFFYSKDFIGTNANQFTFIFGIAIAAGVTALPVLSAILMELNLTDKLIGKKSLTYAAANDLILWISIFLLSMVSSNSTQGALFQVTNGHVLERLGIALLFLLISYFLTKKILLLLLRKGFISYRILDSELVIVLALILFYSCIAEIIGINYLLGSFIFGVIFPKTIARKIDKKLKQFVFIVILPFLFIFTGLKTSFDITNNGIWFLFIVMTIVVSFGKIIGTAIPEKIYGTSLKESLEIGILMQTKGLMEVVFLNILLADKIISTTTFSAMVLVAIATTSFTKPMLLITSRYLFRNKL